MKNIYAIYDRVAEAMVSLRMYTLMTFGTDQEAARYFADAINDTGSILNKHPDDYALLHLGSVDDQGHLTKNTMPQQLITGNTVLAVQQPALVKEA